MIDDTHHLGVGGVGVVVMDDTHHLGGVGVVVIDDGVV